VFATAAAMFGAAAVTFSLAQAVEKANPALAIRLAPYDGRPAAVEAAALQAQDVAARGGELGRLATRALQQDATAVDAVTVLGLQARLRQDPSAGKRLLAYAQLLSRRDVRTQLWSIEEAVAAGDVAGALKWYDITLRTKPSMADTLFAVLTNASAEPPVRVELVRTLAARPEWGDQFARYLAAHAPDPATPAAVFAGLHHLRVSVPQRAAADTINRLIAQNKVDLAWAFYLLAHRGASRDRSRDPAFASDLQQPSSLDWVPINDNGVTTSIQDGAVEFSAPATVGGPLLQQTQLLPPGLYRLSGRSADVDQPEEARPYWSLACLDGRELGRVALPNASDSSAPFTGIFRVPDRSCPIQILTLIGRPSERVEGLSGRIERASLQPAVGGQ